MSKLTVIGALLSFGLIHCGASGQIQSTLGPGVAVSECIIAQVSQCETENTPWPACVAETAVSCGTDAVTIANIWGYHVKAETAEGFTPKYLAKP